VTEFEKSAFLREMKNSFEDVKFSVDYVSVKAEFLLRHLSYLSDKPNTQYLEVGAYEGLTFIWFLKNIFTHPTSRACIIENFWDLETDHLIGNLKKSGVFERCKVIKGDSQDKLLELERNSFDAIMIDGSHRASDVLQDLVLAWPLLKVGGAFIIDDYKLNIENPALRPTFAVDAFLEVFKDDLEVLHKDYFIIVKKKKRHSFDMVEIRTSPHKKRIYRNPWYLRNKLTRKIFYYCRWKLGLE